MTDRSNPWPVAWTPKLERLFKNLMVGRGSTGLGGSPKLDDIIVKAPWVDVRHPDFGATGDGVTDDTAAIEAALAAGSNILVPEGTYRLTNAIAIPNQCILRGVGRPSIDSTSKTTFYCDHAGDGFVITNTGTEEIHLSGFEITKQNSADTGTGLGIKIYTPAAIAGTGVQIDNIKMNYFGTGMYLANTIMDNFRNIMIRNCTDYGIHLYGAASNTGPHDCFFKDIWIYTTAIGIYFDGYNNQHNFEHIKIMQCSTIPIQTTALVQGSIYFNGLMFEINNTAGATSLLNIIGGSHWLFNGIHSAEITPLFSDTTDTTIASIEVYNSRIFDIGKGDGVLLKNVYQEGITNLKKSWSDGINIIQRRERAVIQAPYISGGTIHSNSIITPGYQSGFGKTQYIAVADQDLTGWTQDPGGSVTVTSGQSDPYGGTGAYKLVNTDLDVTGSILRTGVSYGASPANKTFVFQVWVKPVDTSDGIVILQVAHTALNLKGHSFYLKRDEWTLCHIALRPTLSSPTVFTIYLFVPDDNDNGLYLYEPCFFQSDIPNIFQNNSDGLTSGELIVRRWGNYEQLTILALADDATPSVLFSDIWKTGGTTTITDFDDGVEKKTITIIAEHSLIITDGTNIFLSGSTNWSMTATDTLTLLCKTDNKWYEISRSDSGA